MLKLSFSEDPYELHRSRFSTAKTGFQASWFLNYFDMRLVKLRFFTVLHLTDWLIYFFTYESLKILFTDTSVNLERTGWFEFLMKSSMRKGSLQKEYDPGLENLASLRSYVTRTQF